MSHTRNRNIYVNRLFHEQFHGPFRSIQAAVDFIKAELDKDSYWDYDGVAMMRGPNFDHMMNREEWSHLVYPGEKRMEQLRS